MEQDLRNRLQHSLQGATRAEAALAGWLLNNLDQLPFETAASVAGHAGVSEATVGRYCRSLGYAHFKALKTALQDQRRDGAWRGGDWLRDFAARGAEADDIGLQREVLAILRNHETARSPEFHRVAHRLATVPQVFVAGFQTERGHASCLAHMLQYLRPGVQLADVEGGHFSEILLAPPGQVALVLFDARRYSRLTEALARQARAAGVPVSLITDPHCGWAHGVVDELFTVPTDFNLFWDATSAFASLSGLLVNAVFRELGPEVEARMSRVSALHGAFIGHTTAGQGR